MPSGCPSGAHGKHRRAFAASKSLTVPNSSNYFIILCLPYVGIPDLSMLHQFGESDVHLSSPAIIALVHSDSYLEVTLYFCSRTLFLHPFCDDFIHTRIDIFCLLAFSFGNRIPRSSANCPMRISCVLCVFFSIRMKYAQVY